MSVRMRRLPKPISALLLAAALSFAGQGSSHAVTFPTLYVNYTMQCTFTITGDSGSAITSIAPGAYQVEVTTPTSFSGVDLTGISDFTACKGAPQFQLTGPGVSLQTTLNDGDASQDILAATFQPSSTYVAQDNNQPSVTRYSFTTLASGTASSSSGGSTTSSTTTGATTTTATKSSTAALTGTIAGAVSASGKLTLKYKGKSVLTLAPGLYKFTVVDKSKKSGLFVQQSHGATTTVSGTTTVGTHSVTINLKAGQWFYFPTKTAVKTGFVVVTGLEG